MANYMLTDDELTDDELTEMNRTGFRLKTVLAAQVEKVLRLKRQEASKARATRQKKG